MTNVYMTYSPEQTEAVGRELSEHLRAEGRTRAVIALRGDLGVGKTAFTRGFAAARGIRGVKSPTYTVVNEYRGADEVIYHFDMYRIADEDDLYSIGFDEYLAAEAVCIIEWSENIENCLPRDRVTVTIERTSTEDDGVRRITVETKEEDA